MGLLDDITSLIAPHECLLCSAEGSLLCGDCRGRLPMVPERCYRCHRLSPESRTCIACRRTSPLYAVRAVTGYEGLAKDLVWKLKFDGAQAAARVLAAAVPDEWTNRPFVVTHVPTASQRIRQRGYDQAQLFARQIARDRHLPYCDGLARLGQQHQVGASRRQRTGQLKDAFRPKNNAVFLGASVLLVDDVLTTGATLESAAGCLKAAGAKRVTALVFAQA